MANVQTFLKDADAVLDYQIDWSDWLSDGDTISTSTWSSDDGIDIDSDSHTTTAVTVWLSGGTLNRRYQVTNHIETAGGREDDRTLIIIVTER